MHTSKSKLLFRLVGNGGAAMIYCRSDYDYDLLIICMNGGCDEDDYLIVYHIAEIVIYIF